MAQKFPKTYMVSPVGRIFQGDLVTINKTDHQDRPLEERKWNRYFAIAIPKNDPTAGPFLGAIQQAAYSGYQTVQNGQGILPFIEKGLGSGFAWKIEDGDDESLRKKDGSLKYPAGSPARGCWVVKFNTTLEIAACDHLNQPLDPAAIKCGYTVDVSMSISINGATDNTAGIYVNPNTVRLREYTEEIVIGPSIEQQFGGATVAAPQNAPANGAFGAASAPGQGGGTMGGGTMGGGTMGGGATTDPNAGQGTMGGGTMGGGATTDPNASTGGGMPGMGGNPDVNPHTGIMDGGAGAGGTADGYQNGGGMPGMGMGG